MIAFLFKKEFCPIISFFLTNLLFNFPYKALFLAAILLFMIIFIDNIRIMYVDYNRTLIKEN